MRSEKKFKNSNVITVFDSKIGNVYVREPGKVNLDNFEELIVLKPESNEIVIKEDVARKYGIKITGNKSEELLNATLDELVDGAEDEYIEELPDLLGMTKEEAKSYGLSNYLEDEEWIKTDDLQWVKVESYNSAGDPVFDLIEVRDIGEAYGVFRGSVDIRDYHSYELENMIHGYGYESTEDVRREYPDSYIQVIAEIVFESTPDDQLIGFGPFDSEDKAEAYVLQNLVGKKDVA